MKYQITLTFRGNPKYTLRLATTVILDQYKYSRMATKDCLFGCLHTDGHLYLSELAQEIRILYTSNENYHNFELERAKEVYKDIVGYLPK